MKLDIGLSLTSLRRRGGDAPPPAIPEGTIIDRDERPVLDRDGKFIIVRSAA